MKVAVINIVGNPTMEQLNKEIASENGEMLVDFISPEGVFKTVNVIELLKGTVSHQQLAQAYIGVFRSGNYELNRDNIIVFIHKDEASFTLRTEKVIDMFNNYEDVLSHTIKINFRVNNGSLSVPFTDVAFNVDYSSGITDEQKNELQILGISIIGVKWNQFEVVGKCLVSFKELDDNTSILGNN